MRIKDENTTANDQRLSDAEMENVAAAGHSSGTAGNDSIVGGASRDFLSGGEGDDTADGGVGNDTVDGGVGDDQLYGGEGDDTLLGGEGNDTAEGGEGDDALYGGEGNDQLEGGKGNDVLAGGGGADIFVFGMRDGHDTVTDFNPQEDKLEFVGIDGPMDLQVEIINGNTVVTYYNCTVTIEGLEMTQEEVWSRVKHWTNE